MNLTKEHRADFVDAVMRDVPKVDYRSQIEKILPVEVTKTSFPIMAANFGAELAKLGWPAEKAVAA